jgi:hypothetical protein
MIRTLKTMAVKIRMYIKSVIDEELAAMELFYNQRG